jgi:hypothetical protein
MNTTDRTPVIPALPNQGGQANVPGLRRLWLLEARHVLQLIDPRQVPGATLAGWTLPEGGIVLQDDALIHDWLFSSSRGTYEEKSLTTVQGIGYDQLIKLVLPRDAPETTLALMQMTGRKWMAVYTDANGLIRLVGTPKQPLRFGHFLSIGQNERILTWTSVARLPAIYMNVADTLALSAFIDYQSDFSRL